MNDVREAQPKEVNLEKHLSRIERSGNLDTMKKVYFGQNGNPFNAKLVYDFSNPEKEIPSFEDKLS